jgi:hypothetical protein
MKRIKHLWEQNHKINDKTVEGDTTLYYKDNTDTACSAEVDGVVYHFFDGTDNFLEIIKDLLAIKGRKGREGAYLSYDLAAEDFFKLMKDDFQTNKHQVFVGVSRGGSIAMDMVKYYSKYCYEVLKIAPKRELVTFVMPPAGGGKYRKYNEKLGYEHTRVTMKGDWVPRLPFWGKHYETNLKVIENNEKGLASRHKNVGKYLD